jgi:hypothetical protein
MTRCLAPPAARPPASATPPSTRPNATAGPTMRQFLGGYARILLVPLAGVAVLLTGWALTTPVVTIGWPAAVAATAGWSLAVVAWLRHREWPAATAHLAAWAAPAALLAPLSALGWLSADGLILWGPISAVLAVALAAAHDPALVSPTPGLRPPRAEPLGECAAGHAGGRVHGQPDEKSGALGIAQGPRRWRNRNPLHRNDASVGSSLGGATFHEGHSQTRRWQLTLRSTSDAGLLTGGSGHDEHLAPDRLTAHRRPGAVGTSAGSSHLAGRVPGHHPGAVRGQPLHRRLACDGTDVRGHRGRCAAVGVRAGAATAAAGWRHPPPSALTAVEPTPHTGRRAHPFRTGSEKRTTR